MWLACKNIKAVEETTDLAPRHCVTHRNAWTSDPEVISVQPKLPKCNSGGVLGIFVYITICLMKWGLFLAPVTISLALVFLPPCEFLQKQDPFADP